MRKFRNFIIRQASGWKLLLLLALTNLVYLYMLIFSIPAVTKLAGGRKLPDMMPLGYNAEYLQELFSALGEKGRQLYLSWQIPVDMLYPFLFGITYCLLGIFLLRKLQQLYSPWFYVSFLPVFTAIADYLENFGIISLLRSYPEISPARVFATNIFSLLKSITTSLFFSLLLSGFLLWGFQKLFRKKQVRY